MSKNKNKKRSLSESSEDTDDPGVFHSNPGEGYNPLAGGYNPSTGDYSNPGGLPSLGPGCNTDILEGQRFKRPKYETPGRNMEP